MGDRYYVRKFGFMHWAVYCGTGTRILFMSLRRSAALRMSSELLTAFNDGAWMAIHDAEGKPVISDKRVMELAEASALAYWPGWIHDSQNKPRVELRRFVDLIVGEVRPTSDTEAKP
jgi:hypothetical protein